MPELATRHYAETECVERLSRPGHVPELLSVVLCGDSAREMILGSKCEGPGAYGTPAPGSSLGGTSEAWSTKRMVSKTGEMPIKSTAQLGE